MNKDARLTPAEANLLKELTARTKKGEIRHAILVQFPAKAGRRKFRIGFAMPDIKLGIEVDGLTFCATADQTRRDADRDLILAGAGWMILRFTDQTVEKSASGVADTIVDYHNRRVK